MSDGARTTRIVPVPRVLDGYAETYETMAREPVGKGQVSARCVAADLRHTIKATVVEQLTATAGRIDEELELIAAVLRGYPPSLARNDALRAVIAISALQNVHISLKQQPVTEVDPG